MTSPIAGWYPDPAGDATKLRYWDGTKWTDSTMDAAAATQQPGSAYEAAYQQAPAPDPATQQPVAQPAGEPAAQPAMQPAAPGSAQAAYPVSYDYVDGPLYYVSPQDSTLRLVAFILALLSTVTAGFAIIPLAWMIPMTVMTWGIYKGKRPNTVAFGVCSLIFLNVVGGILLLVSNKDE